MTLPKLASGAAGVGKVMWTPHSSAPAAITVTLRGKGRPASEGESATTVVGFASAHTSKKHRATMKIPVTLTAGPKCSGKVPYTVTPSILPKGWKFSLEGATKALRKNHPVHLKVVLRPPAGAKKAAVDVPVAVSFGSPGADTGGARTSFGTADIPSFGFDQIVGIDLLVRGSPRPAPRCRRSSSRPRPGRARPRQAVPAARHDPRPDPAADHRHHGLLGGRGRSARWSRSPVPSIRLAAL